jgi:hypothetical protein
VRPGRRERAGRIDLELDAVDGLVRGEVEVRGAWSGVHLRRERRADVALLLPFARPGGGGDVHVGVEQVRDGLGLGERLLAPRAGHDVVRDRALVEEVHRHLREHLRGAALEEEHLVAGGDAEQLAQERDRLVVDLLVLLAAVAVLHHRHAAPGEVD